MVAYCEFYETRPGGERLRSLAEALLADPDGEGVQLIARDDDGRAVGFATIYWSWSTTRACPIAVMNDLYVDPRARGSGLAEALIERCAAEARDHGAAILEWQTRPDNRRAQRVYGRLGARPQHWVTYELEF